MPVRSVEPPKREPTHWELFAAELRQLGPGIERSPPVPGRNPWTDAKRINRGELAAFGPAGTFRAHVVSGQVVACYVGDTPPPEPGDTT